MIPGAPRLSGWRTTWKGKQPWENPWPDLWPAGLLKSPTLPRICERCGNDSCCVYCGVARFHNTCLCYRPDLFQEYSKRGRIECWRQHKEAK